MYENLHEDMLKAIGEAREANLSFVVVTLQNAIGCINAMQKDAAVLDLLSKHLNNREDNSRIINRCSGRVYKEDWEK